MLTGRQVLGALAALAAALAVFYPSGGDPHRLGEDLGADASGGCPLGFGRVDRDADGPIPAPLPRTTLPPPPSASSSTRPYGPATRPSLGPRRWRSPTPVVCSPWADSPACLARRARARLESPSAAGGSSRVSTTRTSTSSPEGSGSRSSTCRARRVARRVRATRRRPRRATGRRRVGARRRVGPHQLGRGGTDGGVVPGRRQGVAPPRGRARGRGEPSGVARGGHRREHPGPARRDRRPRRRREPDGDAEGERHRARVGGDHAGVGGGAPRRVSPRVRSSALARRDERVRFRRRRPPRRGVPSRARRNACGATSNISSRSTPRGGFRFASAPTCPWRTGRASGTTRRETETISETLANEDTRVANEDTRATNETSTSDVDFTATRLAFASPAPRRFWTGASARGRR